MLDTAPTQLADLDTMANWHEAVAETLYQLAQEAHARAAACRRERAEIGAHVPPPAHPGPPAGLDPLDQKLRAAIVAAAPHITTTG